MNDLIKLSATQLVTHLRGRVVSAVEVLEAHIAEIESVNPRVNALVTTCFERAMTEARRADQLTARADLPPVLHGLPYAVKDTLKTKDIHTTYGSLLFEDNVPQQDELHVARARRAGAIVIGKSNTPEFASGAQTRNAVFGLTRNPIDLSKTVTGSSGGAAAALAAHMVPMADGTDLGGSLRSPASVCGVVGFRPTAGQIPKSLASIPFDTLHVFGPMARTVEDVVLFMSVFAGSASSCPLASVAAQIDYQAELETELKGTRIAWSSTPCGTETDPVVQQVVTEQQRLFENLGCAIDEACPDIEDNCRAHQVIVAVNAISELSQYLTDTRFAKSSRLRGFLKKGQALTPDDIVRARGIQAKCWHRLSEFFSSYDFLVWPTMSGLPYSAELAEENVQEDWRPVELTPSLNIPAISVPAGMSKEGLPIGIQILGPPNSDFKLLQLAYAFQQARGDIQHAQ